MQTANLRYQLNIFEEKRYLTNICVLAVCEENINSEGKLKVKSKQNKK